MASPFSPGFGFARGLSVAAPATAFESAVRGMDANSWLEVNTTNGLTNSNFSQLTEPSGRSGDHTAVISAWGGGVLGGSRFYVCGGGHADYNGNEVYAFDLSAGSWSRLNNPSTDATIDGTNPNDEQAYSDGSPVARHTYGSLAVDTSGRLLTFPCGGCWYSGQFGDAGVRRFDPDTDTWTQLESTNATGGNNVGAFVAVDGSGDFWYHATTASAKLSKYVAGTGWTYYDADTNWNTTNGSVGGVDTANNLLVIKGAGGLFVWDLDSPSTAPTEPTESGNSDLVDTGHHGLDWNSDDGYWYAWETGNAVYRYDINASTASCTKLTPTGDTPGTPETNGTYGRWRWWPTEKRFVLIPTSSSNVFVYRP